jgi:hypothetical protein
LGGRAGAKGVIIFIAITITIENPIWINQTLILFFQPDFD